MKHRGIIWLSLGLCCTPLAAQQILLSKAAPSPARSTFATSVASSTPRTPVISKAGMPGEEFSDAAIFAGINGTSALYSALPPQPDPEICTQAMPPLLAMQDSEYAFGRIHLNAAAIKGTFQHDNLVKMARNFVPGQPLPDAPS